MSIFDHKKNKKSGQTNKGQSKLGNTVGSLLKNFDEIAKEFSPTLNQKSIPSNTPVAKLSTNVKPKSQEEIAKEFLPTNGQASRMSNAFASLKSQSKSQEEIAKEFLPTNGQASRMSNAFASLKSQSKSQEEIAKEFAPSKGQTLKHDNGANLGNQKPKY
ncbi:hypothetical protein BAOM_2778 [Peribacillus asahii]|uniref:Uncharacterized protein n=1 Tax=Peribacillus asahii TaxID=228899 RepID=A0A3Q9RNX0_9BACI|nr:hypothetical protein BAOM_2778 [Peribacillus asahii]